MAAIIMSKARPEERLNEHSDEEGWREEQGETQLQVDMYKVADEDLANEDEEEASKSTGPVWNYVAPEEAKVQVKGTFASKHSSAAKVLKQDFPTLAQSADMSPPKKHAQAAKPKPEKPASSNVYEQLAEEDEEVKSKPEPKPKKTKKTKWQAVDINAKIATTEAAKEAEDIYTAPEPVIEVSSRKYDQRSKRQIGFGNPEGSFKRNYDTPTESAPTGFRRTTELPLDSTPPRGDFSRPSGDTVIRRSEIPMAELSQTKTFVRRETAAETTPTKDFVRREQAEETKPEPKKRFVNSKKQEGPSTVRPEGRTEGPLKDSWTGEAKQSAPKTNAWTTNKLQFEGR
jgi:hypothetical protein